MKRCLKMMAIIMALLCCTSCQYHAENEIPVSETSQNTENSIAAPVENSDYSKVNDNSSDISHEVSDDKKESSLQSSEESSKEEHSEVSVESSSETSQESSKEDSSDVSVEQSSETSQESSKEPKIIDESIVYDMETKYFIKKLEDPLLHCFLQMYDAVQNFEDGAHFDEDISSESLDILMFLLNYDCPELIQLNGDYSPLYTDESSKMVSGVYFTYTMSCEDYKEHLEELHLFFENLKADIGEKSELEKEKYVYDMIFNSCIYDDSEKYSGTVYGTLINHIGRCEGICKSFMWCMRELGSECMCVSGTPKWETNAVYAGHSWNIVKINGKYYQLDLTIDNLKEYEDDVHYPNYGFFNVDDAFCNETHEVYGFYRELGLPVCKSDKANYHKLNHLFVYADDDIQDQVMDILEEHFTDGKIDHISIQFETLSLLNRGNTKMYEWLTEFFKSKGIDVFDYNNLYDEICQTITIYAGVFEDEE